MMISFYRTTVIFALLVALSGCSWFGKNEPEYLASAEHPPLKIPAGLNKPESPYQVTIGMPNMRKPAGDELEPQPPLVANTAGKMEANSYMAWSAEGVYLFVKDTPESVARRLAYTIERSGMTMLESDDSGSHKFQYQQAESDDRGFFSKMAFWRDRPVDHSGTYMTSVRPDGENTRIYLLSGSGEAVDTAGAEHVLAIFMARLG